MDQIRITLPDGSVKEVPKGTTPVEVAKSISPRLADAALVAKVRAKNGDAAHSHRKTNPAKVGRVLGQE